VQAWIRALPKEPLANGQLYIATCAVGTDASLEWYVQAQPGQVLQEGQLIKARAGNAVSSGAGPLSQMTELIISNYKTEKMFGTVSIRCSQ
jgi:hypothetical protein